MVMMPKAKPGTNFELAPAGTHFATCYRVIDLGTQKSEFEGVVSFKRKVMLSWELPDELMVSGEPFSVHQSYTLSSHQNATLRKRLESWRGKPYEGDEMSALDLSKLVGRNCLLSIVRTDNNGAAYANVGSISSLMKGMPKRPLVNEAIHLDLDKFNVDVYNKLSENMRTKISLSPEFARATGVAGAKPAVAQGYSPADYMGV